MNDLCEKSKYTVLGKIPSSLLINLYKKKLDINVSNYFNNIRIIEYREHIPSGIKYFYPPVIGDNSFYEQLQNFEWYYPKNKSEYTTASNFTKNNKILDVGCGDGAFADSASASEYIGLDLNLNVKAIKNGQEKGITLYTQSLSEHSKKNTNTYDVVCLFQILEHVLNPINFLIEAKSCLKENGLLILSVPSENSFMGIAKNNFLNMPPHHITRWPDKSFRYIENIVKMQLIDLRHESLDDIHINFVCNVYGRLIIDYFFKNNKTTILDISFIDKLYEKFAKIIGIFIKPAIKNDALKPIGHTVTAIYRKCEENFPID